MKMRAIIVDDEPLARERIRSLLEDESDVEVIAECSDGNAAVAAVRKHSPDVLFLDIQMPGMDGFEVMQALAPEGLPIVIFVTAYDQHAIKAFEVHALDYLLKPFKKDRFKQTVERARKTFQTRDSGALSKSLLALLSQTKPATEYLSRIPIKTGDKTVFIKTREIDYCEAAGNYVVLHVGKQNHVLRETLTNLEEKLDRKQFVRINRSTLVNVEQIKEVQPLFKGEHVVLLQDGKQLPLTRGVRELEELLKFS